jgi:hypothetical protein
VREPHLGGMCSLPCWKQCRGIGEASLMADLFHAERLQASHGARGGSGSARVRRAAKRHARPPQEAGWASRSAAKT